MPSTHLFFGTTRPGRAVRALRRRLRHRAAAAAGTPPTPRCRRRPSAAAAGRAPAPSVRRPPASTPGSTADFVATAGDRVISRPTATRSPATPVSVLDRQAAWLARYPQVTIRIEGNADERGTRRIQPGPGSRRAESVRAYLVSSGGQRPAISTISYGKERPIDPGTDEDAWAKNRNAHTTLVAGHALAPGRDTEPGGGLRVAPFAL